MQEKQFLFCKQRETGVLCFSAHASNALNENNKGFRRKKALVRDIDFRHEPVLSVLDIR